MNRPRKHLEISVAIRFAFTHFSKHPVAMLIVSLPGALFGLASLLLSLRGDLPALGFLVSIASLIVAQITTAALTFAMFLASRGQPFTPASVYEHVFDRLGPFIAYLGRYWGAVFLLCITLVGIPWGVR